jgi:hypothetical protein
MDTVLNSHITPVKPFIALHVDRSPDMGDERLVNDVTGRYKLIAISPLETVCDQSDQLLCQVGEFHYGGCPERDGRRYERGKKRRGVCEI